MKEASNYQYENSNEEVQELEGKEGKKMKMKKGNESNKKMKGKRKDWSCDS